MTHEGERQIKAEIQTFNKQAHRRSIMSYLKDIAVIVAVVVPILALRGDVKGQNDDIQAQSVQLAVNTAKLDIICEAARDNRAISRVLIGAGAGQFQVIAKVVSALQGEGILDASLSFPGIPRSQMQEALQKITDDCQPIDLKQLERLLSPAR